MLGAATDWRRFALANATRRSMIHALARGETRSAGELGRHFRSAQPTISKHLNVLEQAAIVERKVEGRVHQFRLRRTALEQAGRWIVRHQLFGRSHGSIGPTTCGDGRVMITDKPYAEVRRYLADTPERVFAAFA